MQEDNFKKYENNVRSQFGEDGVIEEIFKRIGEGNKFCIEFGAWDGEHLCNTYNLFVNKKWRAMLIEGDKTKTETMKQKFSGLDTVILNEFVRPSGISSLEALLLKENISTTIDLLSIDIDGDDYYILEGLKKIKPRLIIVEYNPTVPPGIDLVQHPGEYFGSSATALYRLAQSKGYELAHVTETNLFLVLAEEFPKLNLAKQNLEQHRIEKNYTYLISAYDGRTYAYGLPSYGLNRSQTNHSRFQKMLLKMFFKKQNASLPVPSPTELKSVVVA